MKTITLLSVMLASTLSLAAPVSPLADYRTSSHSQYELDTFWRTVSIMDSNMKGKDCFKRAMLWSYKLDRQYGVKSKKVFMHYTDKFNHELDDQGRSGIAARFGRLFSSNDGWDFHVAPVVNVEGKDLVLDPRMRKKPEPIEKWVDYLVERGERLLKKRQLDLLKDLRKYRKRSRKYDRYTYDQLKKHRGKVAEIEQKLKELGLTENPNQKMDIQCRKITHIMEFDRNQDTEWCFYQETSMYYYGPLELRFLNYGEISWDQRLPVTDLSFHNQRNFSDGANYVEKDWDHKKLDESLDEFKYEKQPETIWHL